jgi:hypothetical protein
MDLVLRSAGSQNIVLRPQGLPFYVPPSTVEAAYVMLYWRVLKVGEAPGVWQLWGKVNPGAGGTIPFNPVADQNVEVSMIPCNASGVAKYADPDKGIRATVLVQRETTAPDVTQVGESMEDTIDIAVSNYSAFAKFRRVRIASDAGMSTILAEVITGNGIDKPPRLYRINRTISLGASVNVAASANGGVASASSVNASGYAAAFANNGDRTGAVWGTNGGWNDGTASTWPDWLEIDFSASHPIETLNLFCLQDAYTSPSTPTLGMTGTLFALTDFVLQYWDGAAWVAFTGGTFATNNNIWVQVILATPITTDKIRVLVNNSQDGVYSRVVELEAWTPTDTTLTETIYVAVAHSSGLGYGAESTPLMLTFAAAGGVGGSSGDADPLEREYTIL